MKDLFDAQITTGSLFVPNLPSQAGDPW